MKVTQTPNLAAYADKLANDWPPLTQTQIRRVQALLQSPKIGGGHQ